VQLASNRAQPIAKLGNQQVRIGLTRFIRTFAFEGEQFFINTNSVGDGGVSAPGYNRKC
jgi:hypothetical protein